MPHGERVGDEADAAAPAQSRADGLDELRQSLRRARRQQERIGEDARYFAAAWLAAIVDRTRCKNARMARAG